MNTSRAVVLLIGLAGLGLPAADLRFHPRDKEFDFDTGVLSGKLRAEGKSMGLQSVVHVPSGVPLSGGYGWASHYRVFTANHRYGPGAWYWPSQARLLDDGAVETHWPAADDHPFEMWAVYRWAGPATLDVETRVRAAAPLSGFESFLASYFAKSFTSARVRVRGDGGKPALLPAEPSRGVWQMSPRDSAAVALIEDGRWKIPPSPVDWKILPPLSEPLGVRADSASGLTVVLMAPAPECFAVSTPHQSEQHFSMYLSLFGRSLKPGEEARARARLAVLKSPTEKEIAGLYRTYLKTLKKKPR